MVFSMRIRYLLLTCIVSVQALTTSIVTGANGYVGREVVHELLSRTDQNIICMVRAPRLEKEKVYWKDEESVRVMPYDMIDSGVTLKAALDTCGDDSICVYHVASVFGPTENHEQTALDNVQGTKDLCKVLGDHGNCKLVLTSSMAAVRGTGQTPLNGKFYTSQDWNEVSKLGANWGASYQWSKAESERVAMQLSKDLDIPMVSICPSFVFGPPRDMATSTSYSIELVGQWARGESQVQSRLFVDIRDVATAHVLAGLNPESAGKRYIVSLEARVPSSEIAEWLTKVGGDPDKITFDSDFDGGAIPIGEKEVEAGDRLREELGLSLRPVKATIMDMAKVLLSS